MNAPARMPEPAASVLRTATNPRLSADAAKAAIFRLSSSEFIHHSSRQRLSRSTRYPRRHASNLVGLPNVQGAGFAGAAAEPAPPTRQHHATTASTRRSRVARLQAALLDNQIRW